MATPPSIRHAMKTVKLPASALPMEVTANSSAARMSSRLRPNLSLNAPAISAPTRQPMSAQLLAQPICASLVSSKIALEERLRAADDDPVPAEQQSAHRGDDGDEPDVAEVVIGLEV